MPARTAFPTASFPVRRVMQVVLSLLAAALVIAACHPDAMAAENRTIVVPAEDGYGFNDCLQGAKSCGRVVADAWCEANGLSVATAYGRAEDVTGTTPGAAPAKVEPGAFIVTCAE
jgi:hypothetical protein